MCTSLVHHLNSPSQTLRAFPTIEFSHPSNSDARRRNVALDSCSVGQPHPAAHPCQLAGGPTQHSILANWPNRTLCLGTETDILVHVVFLHLQS